MSHVSGRGDLWLVAGLRTPFAKIDGALSALDAIELSVLVARSMFDTDGDQIRPDLAIWGTVAPNLGYSNIAREILIDADLDQTIPAFSTAMACSTSMIAAFEAAGMLGTGGRNLALVGGVESMSRIQVGLDQRLSDWLRRFFKARSLGQRLETFTELRFRDIKLYIPSVTNRSTGKSMGEHTEEMAKQWNIAREDQDKLALKSHENAVAAKADGFFDNLVTPGGGGHNRQLTPHRYESRAISIAQAGVRPNQWPRDADGRQFLAVDRWRGWNLGSDRRRSFAAAG